MRKILIPAAAAFSLMAAAAYAQPAAAPAAPAAPAAAAPAGKLSADSKMSDLMASPKAKAVLQKNIPMVVDFLEGGGAGQLPPEITLKDIAGFEQAGVTPEMLKSMSDELAKI
jgi:hypothetical protein